MENMELKIGEVNPEFWKDKKVFLTGHTGFKGGWISLWLSSMGAKVTGYALAPNTEPNFYDAVKIESILKKSYISDIRDLESLQNAISESKPDILIHMAAQPLVRYSYLNPVETYAINVMGVVNVLESVRTVRGIRSVVIVTTDKCYENNEWVWGYRENEPMGGCDPYSNSKGCAELVTSAYRQSYFSPELYSKHCVALASARAGNVIGGGDWSIDRLIPDAIRAFEKKEILTLRNPLATRPWQHVLEPLSGYLVLAQALYNEGTKFNGAWNFGPIEREEYTVKYVINLLIRKWRDAADWIQYSGESPHEANYLKLDCSKARNYLGWKSKWELDKTLQSIVDWHNAYKDSKDMRAFSLKQIMQYQNQNS